MDTRWLNDLSLTNDPRVRFRGGQAVFKEGDPGETMFILLKGNVDVYVGNRLVGTFEPIEIVGEMAVIDPGPRCATVIAKSDCELALITQKRFRKLVENKPEFAQHTMRMLVERVRWMNATFQLNERPPQAEAISPKVLSELTDLRGKVAAQAEQLREMNELLEFASHRDALSMAG